MLFFHSVYDFGCVMKIFLQIKWQHDPNEWSRSEGKGGRGIKKLKKRKTFISVVDKIFP